MYLQIKLINSRSQWHDIRNMYYSHIIIPHILFCVCQSIASHIKGYKYIAKLKIEKQCYYTLFDPKTMLISKQINWLYIYSLILWLQQVVFIQLCLCCWYTVHIPTRYWKIKQHDISYTCTVMHSHNCFIWG